MCRYARPLQVAAWLCALVCVVEAQSWTTEMTDNSIVLHTASGSQAANITFQFDAFMLVDAQCTTCGRAAVQRFSGMDTIIAYTDVCDFCFPVEDGRCGCGLNHTISYGGKMHDVSGYVGLDMMTTPAIKGVAKNLRILAITHMTPSLDDQVFNGLLGLGPNPIQGLSQVMHDFFTSDVSLCRGYLVGSMDNGMAPGELPVSTTLQRGPRGYSVRSVQPDGLNQPLTLLDPTDPLLRLPFAAYSSFLWALRDASCAMTDAVAPGMCYQLTSLARETSLDEEKHAAEFVITYVDLLTLPPLVVPFGDYSISISAAQYLPTDDFGIRRWGLRPSSDGGVFGAPLFLGRRVSVTATTGIISLSTLATLYGGAFDTQCEEFPIFVGVNENRDYLRRAQLCDQVTVSLFVDKPGENDLPMAGGEVEVIAADVSPIGPLTTSTNPASGVIAADGYTSVYLPDACPIVHASSSPKHVTYIVRARAVNSPFVVEREFQESKSGLVLIIIACTFGGITLIVAVGYAIYRYRKYQNYLRVEGKRLLGESSSETSDVGDLSDEKPGPAPRSGRPEATSTSAGALEAGVYDADEASPGYDADLLVGDDDMGDHEDGGRIVLPDMPPPRVNADEEDEDEAPETQRLL